MTPKDQAELLLNTIRQQQTPTTEPLAIEGDRSTWHIRLTRRMGEIEIWSLYNGEQCESSPMPKSSVEKWRDEELAKTAL